MYRVCCLSPCKGAIWPDFYLFNGHHTVAVMIVAKGKETTKQQARARKKHRHTRNLSAKPGATCACGSITQLVARHTRSCSKLTACLQQQAQSCKHVPNQACMCLAVLAAAATAGMAPHTILARCGGQSVCQCQHLSSPEGLAQECVKHTGHQLVCHKLPPTCLAEESAHTTIANQTAIRVRSCANDGHSTTNTPTPRAHSDPTQSHTQGASGAQEGPPPLYPYMQYTPSASSAQPSLGLAPLAAVRGTMTPAWSCAPGSAGPPHRPSAP